MTTQLSITVEFGDCDPAGIVFYPNYYRWFDAASHRLFKLAGLSLQELKKSYGAIGFPLLETSAVYKRPAFFGDLLEIETTLEECSGKSLRIRHEIRRQHELLVEGKEIRFLAQPHPEDHQRLRMVEIPNEIREMLGVERGS